MKFKYDQLHKILYKPRDAFEKMKPDVTLEEGIIVAAVLLALGTLISFGIITGTIGETPDTLPSELQEPISELTGLSAVGAISSIVMAIIVLFISALFAGWIASSWANKENKPRKTISLIGYSTILDFVQSVIMGIILAVILRSLIGALTGGGATMEPPSNLMSSLAAVTIIGILFFIWELWVKGTAIAVANDTTTAKGIISWFIATIIIALVIMVITLVIFGTMGTAGAI